MRYFISDIHLSHTNVIKFSGRPFETIEEMDKTIIENVMTPLKAGDDLYFLGDLSWKQTGSEAFFKALPKNVRFHWILGNHDKDSHKYKQHCTSIEIMKEIKINGVSVTLCHYPMLSWNKSHHGAWMLFGHIHTDSHGTSGIAEKTKGKMLNVNCEFHDYKPWNEDQIIEYMKTKEDNWDAM